MASLDVGTEAIVKQDIVDRYADWVTNYVNGSLSWGTNAYPFPEWTHAYLFGGPTTGKAISITGTNLSNGSTGDLINEENIMNATFNDANRYSMFRAVTAQLFVQGAGGNTGTRPLAGTVYNTTAKAFLTAGWTNPFTQPPPPAPVVGEVSYELTNMANGGLIKAEDIEAYFTSLRNAWLANTNTSIGTYVTSVCHASCHTSCHSSRGRR